MHADNMQDHSADRPHLNDKNATSTDQLCTKQQDFDSMTCEIAEGSQPDVDFNSGQKHLSIIYAERVERFSKRLKTNCVNNQNSAEKNSPQTKAECKHACTVPASAIINSSDSNDSPDNNTRMQKNQPSTDRANKAIEVVIIAGSTTITSAKTAPTPPTHRLAHDEPETIAPSPFNCSSPSSSFAAIVTTTHPRCYRPDIFHQHCAAITESVAIRLPVFAAGATAAAVDPGFLQDDWLFMQMAPPPMDGRLPCITAAGCGDPFHGDWPFWAGAGPDTFSDSDQCSDSDEVSTADSDGPCSDSDGEGADREAAGPPADCSVSEQVTAGHGAAATRVPRPVGKRGA